MQDWQRDQKGSDLDIHDNHQLTRTRTPFVSKYEINVSNLVRSEFDAHWGFFIGNRESIINFLTEKLANSRFDLARLCARCKAWDDGERNQHLDTLDDKPIRVGAADSTTGCHGCWYSLIDLKSEALEETDLPHLERLIALQIQAIASMKDENLDEIFEVRNLNKKRDKGAIPGGLARRIHDAEIRLSELLHVQENYHKRPMKRRRILSLDLTERVVQGQ